MRPIAMVVVMISFAACAAPTDPDLDSDGLTDDEDPCPAGISDEAVDVDGDGKDATVDLCPHDANAAAGDLDGDGIPEACDPFPVEQRLDVRRCITSYRVRWMNASHFHARAGERIWNLVPPLRAANDENVSMVSSFKLVGPQYRSVTFDVVGTARFRDGDPTSNFRVWLRAVDSPSNQDVACGIDGGVSGQGSVFIWADNTRQAIRPLLRPINGPFRLRATVQTQPSGIFCRVFTGDAVFNSAACEADVTCRSTTLAPTVQVDGSYGFAAIASDIEIDSVVIDSNESTPVF
jgi:hypothetical protein